MKNYYLFLFFVGFSFCGYSQVGVGTANPNASAQLEIVAANRGVLIPRVSLTSTGDKTTITNGNVNSLLVFNTQTTADLTPGYYYWYEGKWQKLSVAGSETVTTLVDNGNGTVTFTNETGVPIIIKLPAPQVKVELIPGTGIPGAPGQPGGPGAGVTIVKNDSDTWVYDGSKYINIIGSAGPKGDNGKDGASIKGGNGAPGGIVGSVGDSYIDNITGDVYTYDGANWGVTGNLKGPKGDNGKDGKDGKSIIGAAGAPTASIPGNNGDSYVDNTTGDIYAYDGTTWNLTGNIKGAKGDTGADGVSGPQGLQGIAGADGTPGVTGAQGIQGIQGVAGATGPQGLKGDTGAAGSQGIQGLAGIAGLQGVKGDTGADGIAGPQGIAGVQGAKGDTGATGPQGLKGDVGATGAQGVQGIAGITGLLGPKGDTGLQGPAGANGIGGVTTAGSNVTVTGSGTQASPYVVSAILSTTSNSLFNPSNTITSTVNGVSSSTQAVNSVSNTFTSSDSRLKTTVNGVDGSPVDLSSLAIEPWYSQVTKAKATLNTEAIYTMGKVAIGQDAPFGSPANEMLSVNGAIRTTNGVYADYVFEDYFTGSSVIKEDYKFKNLNEVEAYIKENKHLPGVTSIKDLIKTKDGYSFNLTNLSVQSLEKVEELYLHVIEQQKQLDAKSNEIKTLEERILKLEKVL